jgi:serine/threonine protein kinase
VAGIAAGGARPPVDGAQSKRSGSRYVLGDLLGRGGMAEVFAGYSVGDHGFQKPVAIKRLLPELANDDVFVERLIEEAKLLVGMQHGNIVSVLDLAREGDDVFLVMEFVDGPSLRQLIKSRGTRGLSLGVATYVVQSAAAGLEFAHVRPGGAIIHADISPSNLLLTTSGEVRVADFGIARREGLGQGVVEGKWAYMAPEQARGEPLTPRSDVFALGVVLYELLTGQHPLGRAVTADQRDDHIRVVPPRVVKPTVPHGLDAICMRALAHDPRDRYGRMQQLIDAVVEERFTNGYREGAADLAQAIREVAPRSDLGSPRTMHTDRPVTIVTRSLLREVTPARVPSYPLGPLDPPPANAFPMQPTVAATSARAIELPPTNEFAVAPPTAALTAALTVERPSGLPQLYENVPGSGAQTVAREVDQVALAEAAAAAAAMLEIPAGLRVDGTPMPPFRASQPALGEELASVVGGHTASSHGGAVAVEVEPRSYRWTIGVLAAAALIGVGAGIAIQLSPDAAPPAAEPAAAPAERPFDLTPSALTDRPVEPQQLAPTVPPPTTPATNPPPEVAPAPAAPATTDEAARQDTAPAAQDPPSAPSAQGPSAQGPPAVASQDLALPPGSADPEPSPGDTKRTPRRSPGRDAGKHKVAEPGILQVQSSPWSWVTVGNQKKETPDKFYLAPGTYLVKFYNQANDFTKYERVTIEAGKVKRLDERMD